MCPPRSATERYDRCLLYSHHDSLSPDAARPLPTCYWPPENIALLERYYDWLISGGTCASATHRIYLPVAGHVLGLTLKPYTALDLDHDLECVMDYIEAKGSGMHWVKACRHGLEKFRRYLRLERGASDSIPVLRPGLPRHASSLPAWLSTELDHYRHLQERNWRPAQVKQNTCRFWSGHVRVWRYFTEQCGVRALTDLTRQHILSYLDQRLAAGYAVASVNNDLHTLHGFLRFLQDEGYTVPQVLLGIPGLKQPDRVPRFLSDDQIQKLRADFDTRATNATLSSHRRDALLDRAVFYLLWQGGLRISEVEDLRLDDLALDRNALTVRVGKGRKARTVYLAEAAVHALKDYLPMRGPGVTEHVFLYRNLPLKKDLIRTRLNAAGQRAGVKVYPHRLRHTCATQLLNAGCKITSIQKFLGHKRLNTTMLYARAHDQTVADDYFAAMEKIEARMELYAEA